MRDIKKDKYFRSRGGISQVWQIRCSKCDEALLLYQKDGRGSLKRLYLNRILAPENLSRLQDSALKPQSITALTCNQCRTLIGLPTLHWEGRLAFRLVPGSWGKKIAK